MTLRAGIHPGAEDKGMLPKAALGALALEVAALLVAGWLQGPRGFGRRAGDTAPLLQAEIIQVPKAAHLVSEKAPAAPPMKKEATLSKVAGRGRQAKPGEDTKPPVQNQVQSGSLLPPTHGPVALYSPPPVIPTYLRDKELNTSVVIEFTVPAAGPVSPRLIGSSGNEELDAIALSTVAKWQFKPAEKDHRAIDSKIRLRIVFQVY